jgi:hypothetical protein
VYRLQLSVNYLGNCKIVVENFEALIFLFRKLNKDVGSKGSMFASTKNEYMTTI